MEDKIHKGPAVPPEWVSEFGLLPYDENNGWLVCYGSEEKEWRLLLHRAETALGRRIELTTLPDTEMAEMLTEYFGICSE